MEKQRTFPEPQAFTNEARPPIELVAVNSTRIAAVGYDEATKTLAVTFKTKSGAPGPIYHYPNSVPRLHAEFVAAESLGKFYGKYIKDMPFRKYPADHKRARIGNREWRREDTPLADPHSPETFEQSEREAVRYRRPARKPTRQAVEAAV